MGQQQGGCSSWQGLAEVLAHFASKGSSCASLVTKFLLKHTDIALTPLHYRNNAFTLSYASSFITLAGWRHPLLDGPRRSGSLVPSV